MGDKENLVEKAEPAVLKEREETKEKALKAKLQSKNGNEEESPYRYFKDTDLQVLKNQVVIHPTVLLSISDHYSRAAQGTSRRVIGCMLGEMQMDVLHVTNTFGVPFEEDSRDKRVWYLDHCYLDKMYRMFKKINAKERVVGWYSTGSTIKESDIEIHETVRKYCRHPVFLLLNVNTKDTNKLPIQTYYSFEQPSNDETFRRSFVHMTCSIGATEAEEVGVEHLLRDIQNASTSTLSSMITDKMTALKHLSEKMAEIAEYLHQVADGKYPPQPHILTQLQRLLNSLPDKSYPQELSEAFQDKANDALLATYVAFATRLVMIIHDLVKNKLKK